MPLLEDLLAHLEPSELQTVQSALKKADKQGKERVLLEPLLFSQIRNSTSSIFSDYCQRVFWNEI
jgi:hypothetical protein